MYEKFMGDFTYRDSESRQVQLFLSFLNFRASILLYFLYFSTYNGIKTPFLNLKHMLRAQYIGMSLATVICECSLNH